MAELCERCLTHDKARAVREDIFCATHFAMWQLENVDKDGNETVEDMAEYKQLCAKLGHLRYSESDPCDCEAMEGTTYD